MAKNHRVAAPKRATPNNVRPVRSIKKACALTRTAIHRIFTQEGVSVREAAQWLRVSPSSVQRQRTNGLFIMWLRSPRLGLAWAQALVDVLLEEEEKRSGNGNGGSK
jgi:hypothetical protein